MTILKSSELNAESIRDVLAQMSIDLRATVADRLYVQQDLRVYDTSGILDNQTISGSLMERSGRP